MREDLNKLLCERERRGSKTYKFHSVRRDRKFALDPEGENNHAREGMTARYGYETKDFSENLNPLLGQVRKAVGRSYNKFYSELCANFDMQSVINQHILVHLDQYLERHCYVDGKVVMIGGEYGGADRPLRGSYVEFFVDPRDGIIKRNKHRVARRTTARVRRAVAQAELDARYRALPDGTVLRKLGDVWFHCVIGDAPVGGYVYDKPKDRDLFKPEYEVAKSWDRLRPYQRMKFGVQRFVGERVRDAISGDYVYSEAGKPPTRYYVSKRTASHKMLKQAGVI